MKIISSLFAALCLLAGATANAEPELGSRIDTNRGAVDDIPDHERDTALRVMNTFGRCVARNRTRFAEEILAMPLYTRSQAAQISRVLGGADACLGAGDRSLGFQSILLVGAMAEWFIVERYARRDLGDVARLTDERLIELGLAARSGNEDVAICVARADPGAVRALVQTEPASGEERSAIARIVPYLGPCLPVGQTFTLNNASLRATVAAGLYRLISVLDSAPTRPTAGSVSPPAAGSDTQGTE